MDLRVIPSNVEEDSLIHLGDASTIVVAALTARTKFERRQ